MRGQRFTLGHLAAWTFVIPAVVGYIRPPGAHAENVSLESGLFGLGMMLALVLAKTALGRTRRRYLTRVWLVGASLVIATSVYSERWDRFADYPGGAYFTLAFTTCAYITLTVAYCCYFYDRQTLVDVFQRCTRWALTLALAAFAAHLVAGTGWLVHTQYGTPRLQGMLSEPSGWAPILVAFLLLAVQQRCRTDVVMALTGLALCKSPTVILVAAIAIPLYYLLSGARGRRLAALLVLMAAAPFVVIEIQTIDPTRTPSTGYYDQVIGRLAAGVANARSEGDVGANARLDSARAIIEEMDDEGWTYTGLGPGGGDAYLYAKYDGRQLANSFPLVIFTDFGLLVALAVGVLVLRAVARMRSDGLALALFLPYCVAATVNSASGWEMYKFVLIGCVVYGLRWAPAKRHAPAASWPLTGNPPRVPGSALLDVERREVSPL